MTLLYKGSSSLLRTLALVIMLGGVLTFCHSYVFANAQQADAISPEYTEQRRAKQAVESQNFMVTAAHPLAVEAGYKVLKQGGNAIDALVAVQTVLGLVEPQSSGLGGGAFLVYFDAKEKQLTTFDGRETAPLAVKPELFLNQFGEPLSFFDAVVGGRSVATPSMVMLLDEVHKRYGSMPWAPLFEPAITHAQRGFKVSPRMAASIERDSERLSRYQTTRDYFFTPDGAPLQQGHILKNPAYANTLQTIAKEGAQAFYNGQIAQDIVDTVTSVADNPGLLSLEDFSIYKVVEREPVCAPYREYRICGMGPPSSGGITVAQIMGILSHFDLPNRSPSDPVTWQLIGDASQLAFADRGRYIADSDFIPMPHGLLDNDYLAQRAELITEGKRFTEVSPGNPPWSKPIALADDESIELPSTTHMVIVDAHGNIASMTSTIENGFGSRVMSNGFLLNNQLTDFSFRPHQGGYPIANRVEPFKRPRSSMAPTLVFKNNEPYLAIGSPGGSRIIGYVVKSLIAHLDWNMSLQEAIDYPNILSRFGPIELEVGTEAEALKAPLEAMGYPVTVGDLNSGVHGVLLTPSSLIGGADPRREGVVMGD